MNEPHLTQLHLDHAGMAGARAAPGGLPVWPMPVAIPFILAVSLGLWALIWIAVSHGAGLAIAWMHSF